MNRKATAIALLSISCAGNSTLNVNFTPSANEITDCVQLTQGSQYMISGTAQFEAPQLKNTAVYLDLSNPSITTKPIRQALIQLIDTSANQVIAWSTTGNDGSYQLRYDTTTGNAIQVRVLARIYSNNQNDQFKTNDSCNLFLSVLDNTDNAALYTHSSATITIGTPNLNLTVPYAPNRASGPFAILDTAVKSAETILSAKSDIVFSRLNLYWSTSNTNASGNIKTGFIGTSYFGQDAFTTKSQGAIYLLGAANVDTDEYDANVIAHEFGHYLEHIIYRSDSPGGAHSLTALVDLSLAFSEAWGNFYSGVTLQNSLYTDSNGTNNASGLNFNLETNASNNIYNENSVQSALWDIYDSASDNSETVNCSLGTISSALLGLKTDAAAVSFLSFANALQNQAPACATGLSTILTNLGSGAISNSYTPTNAPTAACRNTVYLAAGLPTYTHSSSLNLSFSSGGTNNYCAVKWYRVTGNGTSKNITLSNITATCNLDLYLTQGSTVIASSRNTTLGANESITANLQTSAEYVIRIYTITPTTGTCSYTLNIT